MLLWVLWLDVLECAVSGVGCTVAAKLASVGGVAHFHSADSVLKNKSRLHFQTNLTGKWLLAQLLGSDAPSCLRARQVGIVVQERYDSQLVKRCPSVCGFG